MYEGKKYKAPSENQTHNIFVMVNQIITIIPFRVALVIY